MLWYGHPVPGDEAALPPGLYEQIITRRFERALIQLGERAQSSALGPADAASYLVEHLRVALGRALHALGSSESAESLPKQIRLANEVLTLLEGRAPGAVLTHEDAVADQARLLTAVLQEHGGGLVGQMQAPLRPHMPLSQNALLSNAPHEPSLSAELKRELESADRVDLLCAFIVWSGVRVLIEPLKRLRERGVPVRVITTTYTGTTELRALEALREAGAEIKVSYDTRSTRLHAKAWLFERASGFSTAYIGSSNLSHSAIHEGLEWNVRLSAVISPDLLQRFRATFATYWADVHFEPYELERFATAIKQERGGGNQHLLLFDLKPYPFQQAILERLAVERERHGRWRNLLVAATGTGKTVISAFDYRRVVEAWGRGRLLFVAHRREILEQSLFTFRSVLRDGTFGDLLVGGTTPGQSEHLFASIQTLAGQNLSKLDPTYYDVVIVDEFHHAEAPTYRRLLERLKPRLLLGMTATPERTDSLDVTHWFEGHIAVELRLWDALQQGLLCPFQYFGIADDVDLAQLEWRRGGYDQAALSKLYTGNDARVAKVIRALTDLVHDPLGMRALGFCVSVEHARYMARSFNAAGIPAEAVSGGTPDAERAAALRRLKQRAVNVVFSVDLFNEGIDVPEVDTVLFLRPTESATVFLQQLGRGLRHAEGKGGLTVLDFIGQQHRQFRFEPRFAALTRSRGRELERQVLDQFPYLPAGCSIQLDRVAREVVLNNLRTALRGQQSAILTADLRRLGDVSLTTFLRETSRDLSDVYRLGLGWSGLRRLAGFGPPPGPEEIALARAVGRLLHMEDQERTSYYIGVLSQDRPPAVGTLSVRQQRLIQMLLLDLWGPAPAFETLDAALQALWSHPAIREELVQLLTVLGDTSVHTTRDAALGPDVPLLTHARYTRQAILASVGDSTVQEPRTWREGVRYIAPAKADVFLVTLRKTPDRFSPSTMYRDYALSPTRFHWESQSTTSVGSPTGQRYIHHAQQGSAIYLFAREESDSAGGGTMAYLFLGQARYVSHEGERPMAITWELEAPIPPDFFQEARAAA